MATNIMGSLSADNAAAIAASETSGVAHLIRLNIAAENGNIGAYRAFHLEQSATGHHTFSLTLEPDHSGNLEDHRIAYSQRFLGKRITIVFCYMDDLENTGPQRDFVGVVTHVGFSREHRNRGCIVLTGGSPTLLLDAAPHTQSFGGEQAAPLAAIAETVIKQGLGKRFSYQVDTNYTGNLSYTCQHNETHYNYLCRMSAAYGEQFFYDGSILHFGKIPPPEKALQLTFGKDVYGIEVAMNLRHVNRYMDGYSSFNHEQLSGGQTDVRLVSSAARQSYAASQKGLTTDSQQSAPMSAASNRDVETAQQAANGAQAVEVFTVTGKTSNQFLYPGCVVDMYLVQIDDMEIGYLSRLMITKVSHSVDKLGNYTGHFEAVSADAGFLPAPTFHIPEAKPHLAEVIDNSDPAGLGRVRVQFYGWQQHQSVTTDWIWALSPDAGSSDKVSKNRGFMSIPEKGDKVMVCFEQGHPDMPYVSGGMYHGNNGAGGGKGNNIKSFGSKSGHLIELNDEGGITVKDKAGNTIQTDGNNSITVKANQHITLTNGQASISLIGNKIIIHADSIEIGKGNDKGGDTTNATSLTVKADDTEFTADTKFSVDVKSGSFSLNAGGTGHIESKDAMTIKGGGSDIN